MRELLLLFSLHTLAAVTHHLQAVAETTVLVEAGLAAAQMVVVTLAAALHGVLTHHLRSRVAQAVPMVALAGKGE